MFDFQNISNWWLSALFFFFLNRITVSWKTTATCILKVPCVLQVRILRSKQAYCPIFVTPCGEWQRLCVSEVVFLYFLHQFFFWYFGDMLRVWLWQTEDRKMQLRRKTGVSQNQVAQCNTGVKDNPHFRQCRNLHQVSGIWGPVKLKTVLALVDTDTPTLDLQKHKTPLCVILIISASTRIVLI